jgi:hypothetical protein
MSKLSYADLVFYAKALAIILAWLLCLALYSYDKPNFCAKTRHPASNGDFCD